MRTIIIGVVGGIMIGFIIGLCGISVFEQPVLFFALSIPWCALWSIVANLIIKK